MSGTQQQSAPAAAYKRYAIYWTPRPDTPLASFARAWLGGDAETGERVAERDFHGLDPELVERAVASPRRYGCHATIKAPFALAEGGGEAALTQALGEFCARRRHARTGRLKLHRFWRYLALTIGDAPAEADWLAQQCLTHFDRFRAPLSEADRARRSRAESAEAQRDLDDFGYADIFGRFMFHITLAGPLEPDELAAVEVALAPAVEPMTHEPFAMEDLCLCGDPGDGALFKVLSRHPLMA